METKLILDGSDLHVHRTEDVGDIIENNRRLQGETQRGDWRHVATIPNVILERWMNEEWARGNTTLRLAGPEMDALVARKLKDPDWKYLRTDSNLVQGFMGFGS